MKYIGLDIGGTNFKIGILDEYNNVIFKKSWPTDFQSGINGLIDQIIRTVKISLGRYYDIATIGIGIPGISDKKGMLKVAPNISNGKDVPLGRILYDSFNIPVSIDNDANTAALAELELGAGKEENNFIYLTLGTGVGGSIISDRKLFRGANGGAGELGYIIINSERELNHKTPFRTGILEEYLGRNQIAAIASEVLKKYPESSLLGYANPDPYFISQAIEINDSAAVEIFKTVGYYLGVGLASAMNFLDMNLIIIGGGMSEANSLLYAVARETIKERAIPTIAENFELRKAHFSKDAGIIGAALLGKGKL